jgi:CarD family transcriptional regulator
MWTKRALEYRSKINSGDLGALAEVVRDLHVTGDGSRCSSSQRDLFELALGRLAAELAAINQTAKAEAIMQLCRVLGDDTSADQLEHKPPAGGA